jgi:hypothetical protein
MKLATFRVDTPIGAFDRFGIVRLDGGAKDIVSSARAGAGWMIDANAAYAAFTADRGKANARVRADSFCPADLNACVQIYGPSLDPVLEMSDCSIDGGRHHHDQICGLGDKQLPIG